VFIERIVGSYSGIMGLPLYETGELLRAIGWRIEAAPSAAGRANESARVRG
jgi:septum formation protein